MIDGVGTGIKHNDRVDTDLITHGRRCTRLVEGHPERLKRSTGALTRKPDLSSATIQGT
jgi:hypothetical protein